MTQEKNKSEIFINAGSDKPWAIFDCDEDKDRVAAYAPKGITKHLLKHKYAISYGIIGGVFF